MSVGDMIAATGAELVCGDSDVSFCGVEFDSRLVPAGGAFVGLAGERVDGNAFAAGVIGKGARVAVLTAEPTPEVLAAAHESGACVVRAANDDGEEFMLSLAGAWRAKNPQWRVVGVTGSVGKTTTKDMCAAGLGCQAKVHATKGNFNNLLGAPLTLMHAPADADLLVIEMGMSHLTEIERISKMAAPNVAVITNVGTSHIGLLGSRENIARAKAEVVMGMRPTQEGDGPELILMAKDDFSDVIAHEFAQPAGVATAMVGAPGSACWAEGVALDEEGHPSCTVVFEDGLRLEGTLSLPGRAMVDDALAALSCVDALGLDRRAAFDAICAMQAPHMRMEVRQEGNSARVIDDSYNASPASMAAGLDVLCSLACEGRRVAVLGEMGELGDEAPRLHALVGAYAAAKPIDLLVVVGAENGRHVAEAARIMGFSDDHIECFNTCEDAARTMAPVFCADDLVLVKGSRSVGLDRFVTEVIGR